VQGNFIGTDPSGTNALDNAGNGVFLYLSPNVLIGGKLAARCSCLGTVDCRPLLVAQSDRLVRIVCKLQHHARDLVLHLGRQGTGNFDGLIEQFGHEVRLFACCGGANRSRSGRPSRPSPTP